MPDQKIHVLGYEEIVLLFGLLGIEGTIVENSEDFLKVFNNLRKRPSIGMLIISMDLPNDIIDFLIEFKITNRIPYIYLLPDIFQKDIFKQDKLLKEIYDSIEEIIS